MRSFSLAGLAAAIVAILAGCAGSGGSGLTPSSGTSSTNRVMGANHRVDLSQTLVVPHSVRPNLHRVINNEPFVKPNCCALQKTVFISDAFGGSLFTGAIDMFDYVKGTFLGQVAAPPEGFSEVQGGCADNNGNVYFTNTAMSTIDEYNHGGTYIATLADPGQYPVGCSYDRTTGNLAVSNIISTSGGPGSIAIYNGGTLQNTYSVPNMFRAYFLAYEGNTGVLWLDGASSSGVFVLETFFDGVFTIVPITGATIGFPGGLAWSAKTRLMNLGDQNTFSAPTIYEINDAGVVKGEVVLQCTQQSDICDPVDFAIKGPGLVAPDSVGLDAARFAYPAGGPPILEYTPPSGYIQPIGAAISSNK